MPYNANKLYVPRNLQQLEQTQLDALNRMFEINLIPPLNFDGWKASNNRISFESSLETDLQNENISGLLYDNIIAYLQSKAEDLAIKPYGSTIIGLDNAFSSLDGMNLVSIDEPNRPTSLMSPGAYSISLDFDSDKVTDAIIWDTFYKNSGCGILTEGDISVTGADLKGIPRIFKYSGFTNLNLEVKLFFKYSNNFYGNKLSIDQITKNYMDHYKDIYKVGNDLEPSNYNDISFYPSLAYLNSQFSIDNGTTWLPLNEILPSKFNEIILLDETNIIPTEDI